MTDTKTIQQESDLLAIIQRHCKSKSGEDWFFLITELREQLLSIAQEAEKTGFERGLATQRIERISLKELNASPSEEKEIQSNLKPFKHGEEGTHFACPEMIEKFGGKTTCCGCNGHKCKQALIERTKK